ncbi:MAG: helix-turn-helix domain-containing protein [Butyrivibrio sp.]|nr:helix-turn-helix domain-containing protein [Butyrivibrio sp.]
MRAGKNAKYILDIAYDRHIIGLAELAGRMGWAISTASHKINNPSKMTLKEAKRMCELLDITLDELASL